MTARRCWWRPAAGHRRLGRVPLAVLDGDEPVVPEDIPLPEPGSLAGVAGDRDSETAVVALHVLGPPVRAAPLDAPASTLGAWSDLPSPVDPDAVRGRASTATRRPTAPTITLFTVRRADVDPGPATPTLLTGYGGFAVTMSPAYSPTRWPWPTTAASSRSPASGAGPRRARTGIAPACATASSRCSTTSRPRPTGWSPRAGPSRDRLADPGRQQRRAAGRHDADPAARPVPGGRVRGAAHRHGPLPPVPHRPAVDARVRRPRRGRGVRLAVGLLAVPPPGRGHLLPGHAGADRRGGQPGRPRPRPQVRRRARRGPPSCLEDRPVLVRVESRAGHGQGKPASKQADEAADVHAFLRWQLGVGGRGGASERGSADGHADRLRPRPGSPAPRWRAPRRT